MHGKFFLNIVIVISCVFVTVFFLVPSIRSYYSELDNMREVNRSDRLFNVYLTDENVNRADRAAVVIGDSIYMWKDYKACSMTHHYKILGDIKPPYTVSKDSGSNKIIVSKTEMTLEFCPDLK